MGGSTPLLMAAYYGRTACCAVLLAADADPELANDRGQTASALAAQRGHGRRTLTAMTEAFATGDADGPAWQGLKS